MTIREIDPTSADEVALVAARMRQTLVEVLGEQKGTALYSTEWLVQRVRWHLDPARTIAKVYLMERADRRIAAHAIARIEHDESGKPYGYFSTVFVEPESRNQGVASALIRHVEAWLTHLGMPRVIYNTAHDHAKLIRLFERHGYRISHRTPEMVQVSKPLSGRGAPPA
jgi:GNAT superfamily N-acetyltransferase